MNNEIKIQFFPPGTTRIPDLTYVIIGARENNKWLFVRNRKRDTWELPAGHIEDGEVPADAARRELYEETGTKAEKLDAIHDYSVTMDGSTRHGRIFFVRVTNRDKLPDSEIAEVKAAVISPIPVTYDYAHWKFIDVLETYLSSTNF